MRLTDMPQDQTDTLAAWAKLRLGGSGYLLMPAQPVEERATTLAMLRILKTRAHVRGWQAEDVQARRN